MPNNNTAYVVKITFKRIQQFLFAVPRLKAMTGANALLGETVREKLGEILNQQDTVSLNTYINGKQFQSDPLDPLHNEDQPVEQYKNGILSRDGGHFHVAFKSKDAANSFIKAAQQIITRELPGVQIEVTINNEKINSKSDRNWGESPIRLPQFQVCMDTGNDIANEYKKGNSPEYYSNRVTQLETKAKAFKEGKTNDIIGLLHKAKVLPFSKPEDIPDDLKELAGSSGYIAVIHADGNSIGIRRSHYAGNDKPDYSDIQKYMEKEVKNEEFFHAMRSAIRASAVEALKTVFGDIDINKKRIKKRPYHLLMLGGDDLLLITQPQYAFPFVIEYSKQLAKRKTIPYGNEPKPISIGAGIAIAHHAVPFYHLHTLAENLADSAKKLYRSQYAKKGETPEERSVVDWMVATTSWIDDIEHSRRLYDMSKNGKTCISAKPYFVLPKDYKADNDTEEITETDIFCLKTLWDCADSIQQQYIDENKKDKDDSEKLARSQLKNLLQSITCFDIKNSEKYYKNISPKPRELNTLFGEKANKLWHDINGKQLTQYKDLLELIEVHFLGQQTASDNTKIGEKE